MLQSNREAEDQREPVSGLALIRGGSDEMCAPRSLCLAVRHVSKRFPGVVANDDVSLDVLGGSVHCLLGENGAGKSTLASMIYGVQRPDEGHIEHRGRVLHMRSPRDAIAAGIGMVHQHFELVGPMSTLENVALELRLKGRLRLAPIRDRLSDLCELYGVSIDLDTAVQDLTVGEQQWVEILKALYLGADLLVLDEPTAVLTPSGVEALFRALDRMRSEGLSVVLISHKMNEVLGVSDRITVLRNGRVVDTVDTDKVTASELTEMMVGRVVELTSVAETPEPGAGVLVAEGICYNTASGRGGLRGIDLAVHEREIVGVAGVAGNGQKALFDVLVGAGAPAGGVVRVGGQNLTGATAGEFRAAGVGKVPADRINEALITNFAVSENLILGRHRTSRYSTRGVLNRRAIDRFAQESIAAFGISAPSTNTSTRVLSGGNMQKVILARELADQPRVLVVDQPTRGLDIGATEYVRQQLIAERDRGAAILLISEDLDELLALSTRLIVMHDGRVMGVLGRADMKLDLIGALMTGAQPSREDDDE